MSELKAGKYLAYPEYKDSGVEWLGTIPEHWSNVRLKMMIDVRDGTHDTPSYVEPNDDSYPLVTSKDVTGGRINLSGCKQISQLDYESIIRRSCVAKGDILMPMIGTVGSPILIEQKAEIAIKNLALFRTSLSEENLCRKYLLYFLNSKECAVQFSLEAKGGVQNFVSLGTLRNIGLPFVPREEQTQIANFLDHETAKIDTLIEKQQQLIKLLKEKRQAVISHAVTKGIPNKEHQNVPMKDSGVEWLGEVPEHWVVSKFGYISQVVRGGSPRPAGEPTLFNGDYSPWVTVAEITKDDEIYLTETETFLTKKGSEQCRVFSSGTLLLSNSGATLGVPAILKIDANANDGVVGFENLQIDSEFAYFYLSILTEDLRERVKQGSGQPNLNTDIVRDISIPIPPKGEVDQIVSSIHKLRNDYSKLIVKATSAIELMQERRTALISAAVTGKIDVRNWEQPND